MNTPNGGIQVKLQGREMRHYWQGMFLRNTGKGARPIAQALW